jgi:tetratricopeptide (TPR) repeat protein
MVLFSFLPGVSGHHPYYVLQADTASINSRNANLFAEARTNPDLTMLMAQRTLGESRDINYKKGMADASLALGSAWLTKYFNKYDSALYYCMQAYELYRAIEESRGKARACYYLSYVYSIKGDLDESERYASLSLNFFKEAGDTRGVINAYHVLSYVAKQQNDLKKARGLINEAVELARSAGDTVNLADVLNTLGNIYKDMTLFKPAIDAYFEALGLWESIGDSNGLSIAYGSLGLMYYYQQEWDKALEYCFRKVSVSEARGKIYELSKTYNTIAGIYKAKTELDSALYFLNMGLKLNTDMNYAPGIASTCNDIASAFMTIPRLDSAQKYIDRAIATARRSADPALVEYYLTLGNILKMKGETSSALRHISEAYSTGREKKLPMIVRDASILLSDIYASLNRNDLAYRYLKEYHQINDSISNDEFHRQVTRMEIQYDFDKKQKAAEYARMEERMMNENRINRQRLYLTGLAVLLALVALMSFLYIRHNRLRARYAQIDLEQRLLRAQMNPHFIFNSLSAVQDLILSGRLQNAGTYLAKIARLMRNILESSREEFIPLNREIETVRLYLDLQKLRFEEVFDYDISLDDAIDPAGISIPPMLTQPCVENSIEHGLLPLKAKGRLAVSYTMMNGLLKLEVTDNGVGRKEAAARSEIRKDKRSVSSVITSERLDNFRKTLRNKKISFEITDLFIREKAAGTRVVIMLPYKKIFS